MRNLTIGRRMALAFGSIGLLIVMIIGVALWGNSTEQSSRAVAENASLKSRAAADLSYQAYALLYAASSLEIETGAKHATEIQEARKQYQAASAGIDAALAAMNAQTLDSIDEPIVRKLEAGIASYRDTEAKVQELLQQGTPASLNEARALIESTSVNGQITSLVTELRALLTDIRADVDKATAEASGASTRTTVLITIAAILSLILATLLAIATTRSITRPVQGTVEALDRLAAGDLRVRVHDTSKDELGQMARRLDSAMDQISETVVGIEAGAERLAASSQQLSEVSQRVSASSRSLRLKRRPSPRLLKRSLTGFRQSPHPRNNSARAKKRSPATPHRQRRSPQLPFKLPATRMRLSRGSVRAQARLVWS